MEESTLRYHWYDILRFTLLDTSDQRFYVFVFPLKFQFKLKISICAKSKGVDNDPEFLPHSETFAPNHVIPFSAKLTRPHKSHKAQKSQSKKNKGAKKSTVETVDSEPIEELTTSGLMINQEG